MIVKVAVKQKPNPKVLKEALKQALAYLREQLEETMVE